MTKAEFVDAIAKETKLSKKDTETFVDSFILNLSKILKKKETVTFKGFGSFSVAKRNARTGINPQTKEKIKIPATFVPKFSASKLLKEAINGKK